MKVEVDVLHGSQYLIVLMVSVDVRHSSGAV